MFKETVRVISSDPPSKDVASPAGKHSTIIRNKYL